MLRRRLEGGRDARSWRPRSGRASARLAALARHARASKRERSEAARLAAQARWGKRRAETWPPPTPPAGCPSVSTVPIPTRLTSS